MSNTTALEELAARRKKAIAMGGAERIDRQRKRGKLTVRKRIALLVDQGTFQEYGQLASHASGSLQSVDEITPADGVVFGFGTIDDRTVCVVAEDFTIQGGSAGLIHLEKKTRAVEMATRERVPLLWLLDGAGARAQEMIGEGLPAGPRYLSIARHSGVAPQVAIIMGPCAGDSALIGSECEFVIMVDGTGMLAAGGPPVVLAATGQKITKAELGGAEVHCRISDVADNAATSDEDTIAMARRYLSYLPHNAWEYPPRVPTSDPADRSDDDMLQVVPDDPRHPYDMKELIRRIADRESVLEIKPEHAETIITAFARMAGHTVGIIANQPMVLAGAINAQAARKARHS